MPVNASRLTVLRREPFVVFLIGARVNRWWALPVVLGVAFAMGRMQRELLRDPSSGLLAQQNFGSVLVQYWRSVDDLLRYARDKERAHAPAWRRWLQRWGLGGAVGIWHETYVIEPGRYECVYQHMPVHGLGQVGPLVPAEGELRTARGRLAAHGEAGVSALADAGAELEAALAG